MNNENKKSSFTSFMKQKTEREGAASVERKITSETVAARGRVFSAGAHSSAEPSKNKPVAKRDISTLVVKILLWLVIFLLPLFFLPLTPSVLALSKQLLLVALVGLAFLVWVGKMAIKSQIKFRANFVFVPVLLFLIVMGLSTIFATYPARSLWGFFGGENRSFIALAFLVAFFILFVNVIRSKKDIFISLGVLLASGFLAGLFGGLQLWGKFILPIPLIKNPYFNTIGSVYLFGVYVTALFLLSLNLLVYVKNLIWRIVLFLLTVFFFALAVVVNLKIVWVVLIVAIAFILGRLIIGAGGQKGGSLGTTLLMVFLVLSVLLVLQKRPLINKQLPLEVTLNYKTSAQISWQALKHNFLLGTGPASFIDVYRKFRPAGNLGDFWATNFNVSASYFLTLLSTVGFLGTASFLFVIVVGLIYLFRGVLSKDEEVSVLASVVGSVWLFLTLLLLFYVASLSVLFLWWLLFAVLVVILSFNKTTELREFSTGSGSEKPSLLFSFIFVLVIIGAAIALYSESQKYLAAVHFKNALDADVKKEDINKILGELNKAVLMDPNRDLYYRNRSLAYFAKANKRIADKEKDFSPDDAAFVSEAIRRALADAARAKELNPYDVDNYLSLIRIYESLLPTMEGAGDKALELANKAVELDPNNPLIYQKLANIYVALADLEVRKNPPKDPKELPEKAKEYLVSAEKNIKKAIELQPALVGLRLNLVGIYDRQGKTDEAIKAMIESRKVAPTNPNLAFQLGLLYLRQDKLDEAGLQFIQAIRLDKNYANAHYFLGIVLDKKGKKDLAIKEFEKVLKLNPGNKLVMKILDNLKAGKDALDGLTGRTVQRNTNTVSEGENAQPTIKPEIKEDKPVPAEATEKIQSGENGEKPENETPVNGNENNGG